MDVRRHELDLAIDHRLGREFPPERRAAVWAIQQKLEQQRLRLAITHFLGTIFPKYLVRQARLLAGAAVSEYAKVLSKPELTRFLDLREGEQPVLPVDVDHFK